MRTSTNLATDPTRIPWPGAAWNNPGTSRVKDVTDLHLVREAYGPSGEPYKLLVGKLSGKEAYVLMASNGERMLLKDLQGNLVTDPREVESLVQVITGGHLVAGLPAVLPVILSGPALAAVVAAASVFTLSYLRATSEQDKTAAKNQFFAAINDAINKFPEEADAIIESVKTTLGTVLGQGEDFIKIMSSLVGSVLGRERPGENQKPQTPQPPPHATTSHSSISPTQRRATPPVPPQAAPTPTYTTPKTDISFGTNLTIPNTKPENLRENLSKVKKIFDRALQGTIGSHQDFVDLWNQLNKAYQDSVVLPENLRDPLPPGVTLTQLLVNYQQELIQRRVASLQSALSKDPKAVGAVRQQLEMLENFLHSKPGLQKSGVSAYARKLIELFEQVINRSTPSGVTGAPPAAEFNLAQVAQQIQSLGVKYPGLQTYLQDILRLPAEERWQKLQHLLNGTVSAPGMPPMGPDDQKLLKMVIEGLCNALGSTMFDSLQGKSLEQQLQGLSIAFVVGALTEGNLETRIDVFVANALAAGLEDYVRQLAGLDPAQSGLNNIINMLFGGGLGLGMNELAGLFFKSLSKPRPELVGGERGPYQIERTGNTYDKNKPMPMSAPSGGAGGGSITKYRLVYEISIKEYDGQPFNDDLMKEILELNGYNGQRRIPSNDDENDLFKLLKKYGHLESIRPIISSRQTLDANNLGQSVWNLGDSALLNSQITKFRQASQNIEEQFRLNKDEDLGDAIAALWAVADLAGLSPPYGNHAEFTKMMGDEVGKLLVGLCKKKNIKIPNDMGKLRDLLKDQGVSEATILMIADRLNLSRNINIERTNQGKVTFPFPENRFQRGRQAIETHPGPWLAGAAGIGLALQQIPQAFSSATQFIQHVSNDWNQVRDTNNLQSITNSEEWNKAQLALSSTGPNVVWLADYIPSGAIDKLFEWMPTLELDYKNALLKRGDVNEFRSPKVDLVQLKDGLADYPEVLKIINEKYSENTLEITDKNSAKEFYDLLNQIKKQIATSYAGDPEKSKNALAALNASLSKSVKYEGRIIDQSSWRAELDKNVPLINLISGLLVEGSSTARKVDLKKLPNDIKNALGIPLDREGFEAIEPRELLEAIRRTQPNPLVDFESSQQYQKLLDDWVGKGWVTRTSRGFQLIDAYDVEAKEQMKKAYREEAQKYLEGKTALGHKVLMDYTYSAANITGLNELIRSMTASNWDSSNPVGGRQQIVGVLNATEEEKTKFIQDSVNLFAGKLDELSENVQSSLDLEQRTLASNARTLFNDADLTLNGLRSQILISETITADNEQKFTDDLIKLRGDVIKISEEAIQNLQKKLKALQATQGKNSMLSELLNQEINKIQDFISQLQSKQAEMIAEINRTISDIPVRVQAHKNQNIAQENLVEAKLANEQREIERITRDYKDRRVDWNDRVAKLEDRERNNNPSVVTQGGSWVNTPQYINGFRLPPPDAGTLDEQVRKVVSELDIAGAFDPNAINIPGIGIDVKDSTKAREIISGYYKKFKKYDTGESPKLPPEGYRYQVPGQ